MNLVSLDYVVFDYDNETLTQEVWSGIPIKSRGQQDGSHVIFYLVSLDYVVFDYDNETNNFI